jgi:branched-chain amino acid transport system ATP-binding protein
MLEFIGLSRLSNVMASRLSHGDQRRLEIGISLMNEPKLLLLDEPMAGVGHHELDNTVALIAEAAKGRTVMLIEHNMDIVMSISDKIFVLVSGKLLSSGAPAEIQSDQRVREAYLGIEEKDHAQA